MYGYFSLSHSAAYSERENNGESERKKKGKVTAAAARYEGSIKLHAWEFIHLAIGKLISLFQIPPLLAGQPLFICAAWQASRLRSGGLRRPLVSFVIQMAFR